MNEQIDIENLKEVVMKDLCEHLMEKEYPISTPNRIYGPEVRIDMGKVDIHIHLTMEDDTVHFPIQEHWKYEQNSGYNTLEYVPLDLADPDGLDKSYAKIIETIEMIYKRGPLAGSRKATNG
jgi:hypothetical protein